MPSADKDYRPKEEASLSAASLAFLNVRNYPGRVLGEFAAIIIGCSKHDIPILVRHGLLNALGNPTRNSTKYFATVELLERAADPKWLAKVTDCLLEHWAKSPQEKESAAPRKHR